MRAVLLFWVLFAFKAYAQNIDAMLASATKLSDPSDRISHFSEMFLGKKYLGGKLGEGKDGLFDQDPLYRFDGFDCTTYIETVLALSFSYDVEDFYHNINDIRYKNGVVSYLTRNHFTSVDWIPNNQRYFEDVTEFLAGEKTLYAVTTINKKNWYAKKKINSIEVSGLSLKEKKLRLKELQNLGSRLSNEEVRLPYIAIDDLLSNSKIRSALKTGIIANIVRPDWGLKDAIGTNINISHQGLIIKKADGHFYLRHASLNKEVKDEKLDDYLKKYKNHKTVKGLNILESHW